MENFSQLVRDEVTRVQLPVCRKCIKAELSAIIHMAGSIHLTGRQNISLSISTSSAGVARKAIKLIKAVYFLESEVRVEQVEKLGKYHRYLLIIPFQPGLIEILYDLGMLTREHSLESGINSALVRQECCRASFLRGAFLAGGSITDPQKKTYHLELVTQNEEFANGLVYLMNLLNIKAKLGLRKGNFLVYLKDSNGIARFLSLINAHAAVIKLEEIRVIKGLRGEVNRLVNCETANLEKTLSAAWELVELIKELKNTNNLKRLPVNLQQTALLRVDYPEVTLKELGELHSPPISKSAVNHRLRLIRQFAKKFTDKEGI